METRRDPDPRWRDTIARVRGRSAQLRSTFMQGFPADERYGEGTVPVDDVREVVDDSISMFLLLLSSEPLPERLETFPERLGTRRAQQGVDVSLLLSGVRSNFTVLWDALREELGQEDPGLLVSRVQDLLTLVEQHVSRVQGAFLRESSRLNRDSERRADQAMTSFFASSAPQPEQLAGAAAALSTQVTGRVWLAAVISEQLHPEDAFSAWARSAPWQDLTVLLSAQPQLPELPSRPFRGIVTRHPVELSQLPRLVRELARLTPMLTRQDGMVSLDTLILRSGQEELSERFEHPALVLGSALFDARDSERERLLETLTAYLDHGSIGKTATQLFCHRNTVVTRLRRIEELTGYDPLTPRDCVLLALLLRLF